MLVTAAVDGRLRDQREQGRDQRKRVGRHANRFARLLGVDDATWAEFRALAIDARVSTARAVGLVVEHEAWHLGWNSEGQR